MEGVAYVSLLFIADMAVGSRLASRFCYTYSVEILIEQNLSKEFALNFFKAA